MNAPAAARVPSWANWAIFCLFFTPAVMLVVVAFIPPPPEELGPPGGSTRTLGIWISSLACLAATVPIAARLALAPHLATAFVGVAYFLGRAVDPQPGPTLSWMTFGGIVLAWVGRGSFTRSFDLAQFPAWALEGYRRLIRSDRGAALRFIAGIALFLGGIFFMVVLGTVLRQSIPVSRPVAKFLAIPAFLGAFLAASGMSLSEPPQPQ